MKDNTIQTILVSLVNEDNKGFSSGYPANPETASHIFYAGRTDGIYCAAKIIAEAIGFPFYNETIQNYLERWQEASHNNKIDTNQPLIPYLEKQQKTLLALIDILNLYAVSHSDYSKEIFADRLAELRAEMWRTK